MSNSFHIEFATFTTLHFDLPFLSVYRNETGKTLQPYIVRPKCLKLQKSIS